MSYPILRLGDALTIDMFAAVPKSEQHQLVPFDQVSKELPEQCGGIGKLLRVFVAWRYENLVDGICILDLSS